MVSMIPTTINDKWTLLLPEHRAARPEWPTWEAERLSAMHDHIRVGDVVYDVGAEEGDFPALWVSWGAKVFLFEPNPKVWPNIKVIFEANNMEESLLGGFVGFAGDFERQNSAWDAEHIGDGRWPTCANGPVISDHGFLVLPERPEVPVTTIDATVWRTGHTPDHITIDVEGAELTVLRGASKTLISHRPIVFVSVHIDMPWIDEKYPGDTGDKVAEYMSDHGYVGTHLVTDHEEHWVYMPQERAE